MGAFGNARRLALSRFLIGEFLLVAIGIAAILGLGIADMRAGQHFMQRCAAAQAQLAIATRIEADAGALLLARAGGRDPAPALAALKGSVTAYAHATEEEAAIILPDDRGYEAREEHGSPALFARMVAQIEHAPDPRGDDLRALQAAVRGVARRESIEIAEASAAMDAMQARSAITAPIAFAAIALILALAAFALWRLVVCPAEALAAAAARVREGVPATRVDPAGIAELHQLGKAFNAMADEVDARVAARTAELEARNRKLAEIDRSRRLFFAKIGHELRTPLAVMMGEADVALRDPDPAGDRMRDALAHIGANGGYLARRLDDMLATARSEDGLIQLDRKPFDLFAAVRGAAEAARAYALSSEVTLALDLPDGQATVKGDAGWLRQAMLAVIDNAVKFSGAGTVTIAAQLSDRSATIAIADDGPGVAPEELAHIFDSYFQGGQGRAHGGSGLGLALAQWVVLQHGGTIVARQGGRQGLTIEFRMKLAA